MTKKLQKLWSLTDKKFLQENIDKGVKWLCKEMDRSHFSIGAMIRKLKLKPIKPRKPSRSTTIVRKHKEEFHDPPDNGIEIHTDEESEFLKEILRFQDKYKRRPTLIEGFRIARRLGWRKQ